MRRRDEVVDIVVSVGVAATPTRSRAWAWVQGLVGVAVLVVLAVRFGAAPIHMALASLDARIVGLAVLVAALGTVCAAYRWRIITIALAVPVALPRAVGAYYGSQFLNSTLPGGVLGDVHRGLRQGRDGYPLGRSLRAVAWDRMLGQVVQVTITLAALTLIPSPLHLPWPAIVVPAALVSLFAVAVVLWMRKRHGRPHQSRSRVVATLLADWRAVGATRGALPRIAVASVGVLASTVTIFVISAHAVSPDLAVTDLLPVALVVLLVGALPINVAGWGPREGAAAWAFGVAGLGAAQGLSVSVVFGVLSLIGTLPGVVTLVLLRRRRRHG